MTKQDLPADETYIKPGDILIRPIHTYAPMQEGKSFIAIISGFPMYFKGSTAIQARKIADDFRLVQSLKIRGSKFPDHLREKAEAAVKRMDKVLETKI